MSGPMKGKQRRELSRFFFVSKIRYALFPKTGGEEFDGLAFNVSLDGLCLFVDRPLMVGQEIFITRCLLPFCRRTYAVLWSAALGPASYKVGLGRKD